MEENTDNNAFTHPGFIGDSKYQPIGMHNLNNVPERIEGTLTTNQNQELSGLYFKQNSPDLKKKEHPQTQEGNPPIFYHDNNDFIVKREMTSNEEPKVRSYVKQETQKSKGVMSDCLRKMFNRQKKYEKIRVYFGPNSSQDSIYNHPKNNVRTTKLNFIIILLINSFFRYNAITWFPKSLMIQFFRAANIYFLLVTILTAMPFSPKVPFFHMNYY